MSWVRLEDTFPEHPKLLTVGGDAGWLHVCAIAYCSRNLTDGLIPAAALRQISDRKRVDKLAAALVLVGLWEESGQNFVIHDYLEYHPTRAETEAQRAHRNQVKVQAGHLGGIASGVARRKHKRSTSEANDKANTNENEAPTRPDPNVLVGDNSTLVDTPSQEEESDIERITQVADHYANIALQQANNVTNPDAYRRSARQTALAHPDIDKYLNRWPTAPANAIAAWLHGDKHSMAYYHDTLDDVATVHHLRGEPA